LATIRLECFYMPFGGLKQLSDDSMEFA